MDRQAIEAAKAARRLEAKAGDSWSCSDPECNDCAEILVSMRTALPDRCRRCWWRENGRCLSEDFGEVPVAACKRIGTRKGHEITADVLRRCSDLRAHGLTQTPRGEDS